MEEIKLSGRCLYTPGGAAREYAAVGCNFYRGCPFQCEYCYNRTGITAPVNGLPYAHLQDSFGKECNVPKKYRDLTGEQYALLVFKRECEKWYSHLAKYGIFFSFTTDPLSPDTYELTIQAALYAAKNNIPVKILTKNAGTGKALFRKFIDSPYRMNIALGFTLTGRDDLEPHAPSNAERIETMRWCRQWGLKTFVSVEPIVDFESSFRMIEKTAGFCNQHFIGLMSNRHANGFEPYDIKECNEFLYKTTLIAIEKGMKIYWKDSIRNFAASDFNDAYVFGNKMVSVGRDWSLFNDL